MAYFIALGILSLAGIVGTVWLVRTDGYGRIPTDPSRVAAGKRRTAEPDATPHPAAVAATSTPALTAPAHVSPARRRVA